MTVHFPHVFQVMSIIAFACSISVGWGGGGWVNFVSISGFIQAVIWFVLHLLRVIPQIMANYLIVSASGVLIAPNYLIVSASGVLTALLASVRGRARGF